MILWTFKVSCPECCVSRECQCRCPNSNAAEKQKGFSFPENKENNHASVETNVEASHLVPQRTERPMPLGSQLPKDKVTT